MPKKDSPGITAALRQCVVERVISPKLAVDFYERGIETHFIHPPIPVRDHDWCAYFDDYDGAPDAPTQPTGHGKTEMEAVMDLITTALADMLIEVAREA